MGAVKISTQTTKTVTFESFGKSFSFVVDGSENTSDIKPSEIVPILSRQIMDVQMEWGRKDDKKVMLFYKKAEMYGYMTFVFAVEANDDLLAMMKEDEENIPKMIKYLYNNEDKLNFKV